MYIYKKNAIMLALSIFSALILPSSLFSQGAIVGYADGNKHVNANNVTSFPTNAQLDRLTHVIAVGLGVNDPSGTLKTTDLPNFWNGNTNAWVANLESRAHQRGIKVSISITGESEFNYATSSSQKINAFATQIANFVNSHGLDGVEINWEHPIGSVQWNRCISLLAAIRSALPNNKKLSISLQPAHPGAPNVFPNQTPNLPIPQQIWQIVDAIHIMTYDEAGDWPTHSDTIKSNTLLHNWGVWGTTGGRNLCKGKLFVGSAFYGWKPAIGIVNGRVPYHDYINIGPSAWTHRGDLPADARSKAIYTRDNGFGGVFIWELGGCLKTWYSATSRKINFSNIYLIKIHYN
jgi:GH18 family chitinase